MLGIRDISFSVGKSQLHRFQLAMQRRDAVFFSGSKAVQNVQRHQSDHSLAVRRNLPDLVIPIARRDGLDPFRPIDSQIFGSQKSAVLAEMIGNFVSQFAAIERFGIGPSDFPKRSGMMGRTPHFSGFRSMAVRREGAEPFRVDFAAEPAAEDPIGPIPEISQTRRNRVSFFGITHGRRKRLFKGQAPEPAGELGPSRRSTRDGNGHDAVFRHFLDSPLFERIDGQRCGSRTACVQAVQLAVGPDQREGIAPDPVKSRLQYRERGGRGDGGIDGVAACFQNVQSGLRGQRLGGSDHAVAGIGRKTAGGVGLV